MELHEGTLSHSVVYPQATNIATLPKIITASQEMGFPSCLEEQVLLHGSTLGFYLCFELEDESVRGVIYFCLMSCINSQTSVRFTCQGPCVEGQCNSPVTNSLFCMGPLSSSSWTLAGELSIYRTLLLRKKGFACPPAQAQPVAWPHLQCKHFRCSATPRSLNQEFTSYHES